MSFDLDLDSGGQVDADPYYFQWIIILVHDAASIVHS